ncbi:MAG: hypothetical protein WCJ55_19760 [Chloroflexales bacterium]
MEALDPTTTLAVATVTKILVDLVRATQKLPAWASPLLALGVAEGTAVLLLLASGGTVTSQTIAHALIAGILATGTAVGSTELQRREKRVPPADDLLLDAAPSAASLPVALSVTPVAAAPSAARPGLPHAPDDLLLEFLDAAPSAAPVPAAPSAAPVPAAPSAAPVPAAPSAAPAARSAAPSEEPSRDG